MPGVADALTVKPRRLAHKRNPAGMSLTPPAYSFIKEEQKIMQMNG